ncbi:unnamed protein product, partial [Musa textilis]
CPQEASSCFRYSIRFFTWMHMVRTSQKWHCWRNHVHTLHKPCFGRAHSME